VKPVVLPVITSPMLKFPTGGYLIDPARLGLAQLQSFIVNDQTAGYSYDFDSTTSKLKLLSVSGGGGPATNES